MKLKKLTLKNFRQFKGEQEIIFSDLDDRNVTLIHAENGFGKTALLNALLWGFYGADGLTSDLEKPESIVHEGTAAGANNGDIAASVVIQFEHEGDRYFLTRSLSLTQQKIRPEKTDLVLNVMRDGQTFPEPGPQQRLNTILPQEISPRIFFNGERIDHLAMREHAKEVTEAIEQMLGLQLLRTTIEDLQHQSVRGELRKELRELVSDEKRALVDQLNELDAAKLRLENDQAEAGKEFTAAEAEIAKINTQLEKDRAAYELQKQREALEGRETELGTRLDDVRKKLGRLLAEDGYTLFGDDLVNRGREIVNRLRAEGKIPARVLNSFLLELLNNKTCICTRHLSEGSPERKAVEELLTVAGDQAFNNAVGALDHAIGVIEEASRQTRYQLSELNRERLQMEGELKVVGEQIESIHQQLGGRAGDTVAQLEAKRSEWLLKRDEIKNLQGRLAQRLDDNEKQREVLKAQLSAIRDQEENARKAQRRLDTLEQCITVLDQILKAEREALRPYLNEEINRHFQSIIDRDYWAELSEDFVLTIRKNVAGGGDIDVAQSTGQRQITSLVFIGSLVALAEERTKVPTILKGISGSVYPLVMDSPFGQLGDRFTRGIARLIPKLASQVVILVTAKQYKGAVEEELKTSGRIGKRYMLVYQAPSLKEDAADELAVEGNMYKQYSVSDEEMTEIRDIEA
ncbi:MAG: AAA family ATPase [Chthoniobacteraceae bacterium]